MRNRGVWVPDRACFRSLVRDDSGEFRFDFSNSQLRSRRVKTPELCQQLPSKKQRAQGMPGARCTRSLACKNKKAHEVVTTGSPEQPGIPRAMVLTVSFVISPVIGLSCHRRRRNHFRQT